MIPAVAREKESLLLVMLDREKMIRFLCYKRQAAKNSEHITAVQQLRLQKEGTSVKRCMDHKIVTQINFKCLHSVTDTVSNEGLGFLLLWINNTLYLMYRFKQ